MAPSQGLMQKPSCGTIQTLVFWFETARAVKRTTHSQFGEFHRADSN